ncbi:hypothetical protein NQ318_007882 [Aromia moschata]|uniref:Uncharacterized protein n=1 Tax=Aromia moschata TaxID=1265417 RepID=A0AAV8XFL4_9CUCU|nr:hypothetical protein NQ318_007882 [Aromia moschata]
MAFHHVALFFTIIFLWHLLASAQLSLASQRSYLSPEKSRNLLLRQPLRSTRKISQRAFQDMDLFTARGYGKRSDCAGRLCGKRMPEFSGARLYGKRNIDITQLKWWGKDAKRTSKFEIFYKNYLKIVHLFQFSYTTKQPRRKLPTPPDLPTLPAPPASALPYPTEHYSRRHQRTLVGYYWRVLYDIENHFTNLFIDCTELKTKMRNMDYPSRDELRRGDEIMLSD